MLNEKLFIERGNKLFLASLHNHLWSIKKIQQKHFALHFYYTVNNKNKQSFQGSIKLPGEWQVFFSCLSILRVKASQNKKKFQAKRGNKKIQVIERGQLLSSETVHTEHKQELSFLDMKLLQRTIESSTQKPLYLQHFLNAGNTLHSHLELTLDPRKKLQVREYIPWLRTCEWTKAEQKSPNHVYTNTGKFPSFLFFFSADLEIKIYFFFCSWLLKRDKHAIELPLQWYCYLPKSLTINTLYPPNTLKNVFF